MNDNNKLGFGDFLKENVPIIEKAITLKEKSNIIIFKCLTKTKFDNKNYIFYISLIFNIFHFILLSIYIIYKKKIYKNKKSNTNKIQSNQNSKIFKESLNTEDKEDNLNSKRILFTNVIDNKNNDINKTITHKYNELELENNMFNQNCISNNELNKMYSNDILKVKHKKNILSLSVPIQIYKNNNKNNNKNKNKNEKNSNKFHIIFGKMIYKNLFEKFSFEKKLLYEYIII